MITVISGTNRPNNQTLAFAKNYVQLLKNKGQEALLFSLDEIPADFTLNNIYDYHHPGIQKLIDKYITPAEKIVIISPEYNGSIPGVLKVFIDSVKPSNLRDKKVALVGIAEGRAGNLRGMDHLTNILNYLNMEVLSYKLPISKISTVITNGEITDQALLKSFELQIEKLIRF